jgi:hypothetical protein
MKNIKLKYYLVFLIGMGFIMCKNNTKNPEGYKDIFELIIYPQGFDTLDCNMFDSDYIPYPCLDLHKRTFQEVDSLLGKPLYTRIDTLYYGHRKDGGYYDHNISKMLSNVHVAIVTYTNRKVLEHLLYLYFVEYEGYDLVFYGFRISPRRILGYEFE